MKLNELVSKSIRIKCILPNTYKKYFEKKRKHYELYKVV